MFHSCARGATVSLFAILSATGAWADLTADEVWAEWKSYLEGAGYAVTAAEQRSGNTLTISGFEIGIQIPDEDVRVAVGLDTIAFSEKGDGTVDVDLPGTMPLTINGSDGSEVFDVRFSFTQTGHSLNVSGSASDLLYTYAAASSGMKLDSLTVDGAPLPPEVMRFDLTMGASTSTTRVTVGALRSYDQQANINGMSYNFAFADPESSDRATMTGQLGQLSLDGGGQLPLETDPEDVAKMLKDGMAVAAGFSYRDGSSSIAGTDGGDSFSMQSSSAGGRLGIVMNAQTLEYDVLSEGAQTSITSGEFPFPISLEMAQAALKFAMPIGPSQSEQDFAMVLSLIDFKMADLLWGIFDPGGVLPRDAATIDIDMSGKAKLFADIFDPAFPDNLQGPPGELNALSLNKLLVSMVGANLSGTGAFTFDNTDLDTFDGFPRPIGAVNLQLKGANGLLDNLISMGLVGDQEALGARMMMGMLAVPGSEPDSLNSKIEINEQGHVLANGQRIQ